MARTSGTTNALNCSHLSKEYERRALDSILSSYTAAPTFLLDGRSLVEDCGLFSHTPVAEKTIGVKDECSTSVTLCFQERFLVAPPPQNPFTETSSLAPSDIEVLCDTRLYLSEVGDRVPPRHHGICDAI